VAHKTTHAVVGWAFTFLHRRSRRKFRIKRAMQSQSTDYILLT